MTPCCHRFFLWNLAQKRSPWKPKIYEIPIGIVEPGAFCTFLTRKLILLRFGTRNSPFWRPRTTRFAKKTDLRGPCENDPIFVSIFFLFRRPLGAHLAPNMAPLGAAKATQEAPLGPPGASLEPPRKPSGARRRPGTTQTPSRHRFWEHFGDDFVSFLLILVSQKWSLEPFK